MTWILFDEQGQRAQQLTYMQNGGFAILGWGLTRMPDARPLKVLGFAPERTWRPTWFAVRMAQGYRVFELDVGVLIYADENQIAAWWRSAAPEHKRLPHIAAVEMYARMLACRSGR